MTSTRPSTVNPQQQKDSGASNQLLPEEVGTSSLTSTQQVPIVQPVARRGRPKKSTQIAEKLANKVTTSNSKGKKREAENQEAGPEKTKKRKKHKKPKEKRQARFIKACTTVSKISFIDFFSLCKMPKFFLRYSKFVIAYIVQNHNECT